MPTGQKRGPAIARVTFRRHQAVVEQEFREGWSALAIYERHKAELSPTISYRQFLRYVSVWRPEKPNPPSRARSPERKAETLVEPTTSRPAPSLPPAQALAAEALPAEDDEAAPIREPRHKFGGVPATNRVKPKSETT
jgi:hypothetical protein